MPPFPKGPVALSSLSCECLIYVLSVTGSCSFTDPPSPAAAPLRVCFPPCSALHQLPQREPPRHPHPPTLVQECRPLEHQAQRQQAVERDLRCVCQPDAYVQGNQTAGGRLTSPGAAMGPEQSALPARAKQRLHCSVQISPSLHLGKEGKWGGGFHPCKELRNQHPDAWLWPLL